MQTVLITGGTGLVGSALSHLLLEEGYRVIILSRSGKGKYPAFSSDADAPCRYAHWDPVHNLVDESALQSTDHIVHLAGAGIAEKRWTAQVKQEIRDSRMLGTRLLFNALSRIPNQVRTFVSASATGYYGHDPVKLFRESDPPTTGFLGDTCVDWETEARRMETLDKRVVILRTGIALSLEGGLMPRLVRPLRFGIMGVPGNGEQWISWIHLRDLIRVYLQALMNPHMQGTYNAVSPFPIPQKQLLQTVARSMKGRFYIPVYVPEFLLRWLLGEMGGEVTGSNRVSAEKLLETGFEFSYPEVGSAIAALFGERRED